MNGVCVFGIRIRLIFCQCSLAQLNKKGFSSYAQKVEVHTGEMPIAVMFSL